MELLPALASSWHVGGADESPGRQGIRIEVVDNRRI